MCYGYRTSQRHHASLGRTVSALLRHIHELSSWQSQRRYSKKLKEDFPNDVQDKSVSNQFRPAILQTFGDIAQAIGSHFETYLSVVAQVLQSAANVTMGENAAFEMFDYVISLREGIMDAWSGAILAMKSKRM